jgi:hypothetical protein
MALSNRHIEQIAVKKIPKIFNEECRGLTECCDDEWLVLHDQLDNVRWKNDVTSAFSLGDSVDFILKKNGVVTTYTPLAVALPNEPNCYSTTIEWRDVFMSDGNGLFELSLDVTSAGDTVSTIWGNYNLLAYSDGLVINASGTTRVLSYFNDYNSTEDIDFTGAFLKDSIRFKAFFGFWKPNTIVDNLVFEDGEKVKVSREDFFDYELRVDLHGKTVIDALLFHLRSENTCFITDHNAYNYSYNYLDYPVIVKSGFEPNWISGTRKVKGVAVFEDKKKRFKTSFNDDDNTGKFAPPTNVCLPSIITDGLDVVNVASGQSYTCVNATEIITGYTDMKVLQRYLATDYGTGDQPTRGRASSDYYHLNYVNEWGHSFRLVGSTGGYTDGASYFDVAGVATTRSLAYPNDIIFDFSSRTQTEILSYYIGDASTYRGYTTSLPLYVATAFGGLTGWYLANDLEYRNLMSLGSYDSLGHWLGHKPFDYTSSNRYFISSSRSSTMIVAFDLQSMAFTIGTTLTNALLQFYVRYTTLTELGL